MSEGAPTSEGPSAGTLLRQAREAAGLHVATLAATLKVPVRKLEALEDDQYEQLGDAVFVRGLASSVCRTLKIDPQPVLQRLPQSASPRLVSEREGINAPFRAPGDGPHPGLLDQVSRPVVLTVLALLLGALVLIFLPMTKREEAPVVAGRQADPVLPPSAADASGPSASVPAETPAAAASEPASMPPVATATVAPAPAASAAAVVASAAPAPAAATPAQAAASGPINARGIVVFRTKGQSWVQVTDATGATVYRRLMQAGETGGASGALPLSVTVGSVEATEVQVRGKPYDLATVARDNVARFEIK